jgi:hypothetical protein
MGCTYNKGLLVSNLPNMKEPVIGIGVGEYIHVAV